MRWRAAVFNPIESTQANVLPGAQECASYVNHARELFGHPLWRPKSTGVARIKPFALFVLTLSGLAWRLRFVRRVAKVNAWQHAAGKFDAAHGEGEANLFLFQLFH